MYPLVVPSNTSLNMTLYGVIAESFSDEVEVEEIPLINRGRQVQFGTDFGRKGVLNVQLRDRPGNTALAQRTALTAIFKARATVQMTNAFSSTKTVVFTSIEYTRIAGLGATHQGVDVSLAYTEITA